MYRTWPSLLSAALCAFGAWACESPKPPPEPAAQPTEVVMLSDDEEEPVHDGRWVYEGNCAGCHNENGDGQGPTMLALGLKARSFAQGGFAFGNTREAIFRTISAGMPGSSVMPSFKATLTDDERWLVVDYVLTLCPRVDEKASGTALTVRDRPQIARGLLPAVVDGQPEWPRGILIGTPEGLTFEYRTDDVRLLAVRQGDFADRTDWNERGGGELVPLGKAFFTIGGGNPDAPISILRTGTIRPGRAQLRATIATKDEVGLDYDIYDSSDKRAAIVKERVRVEALPLGGVFTRSWEIRGDREANNLIIDVGAPAGDCEWVRGVPETWQQIGQLFRTPVRQDGWIVAKRGDVFECVHVAADKNTWLVKDSNSVRLYVPVFAGAEHVGAKVSATIVMTTDWSEELLAELGKEIAR
ncbi:MAG: cytochrome c [Planctomycetes bacterium]|nr:cytochrome c [Planctomycetota bacterium]